MLDWELMELLKNALFCINISVTNVSKEGQSHWCPRNDGKHDATCSVVLATQRQLRDAIESKRYTIA